MKKENKDSIRNILDKYHKARGQKKGKPNYWDFHFIFPGNSLEQQINVHAHNIEICDRYIEYGESIYAKRKFSYLCALLKVQTKQIKEKYCE